MEPKKTSVSREKGDTPIGKRLKEFARSKFSGVAQMERAIDRGVNFFGPYIDGKSKPGSEILRLLAEQGLNVNWLLTGDGSMYTSVGNEDGGHLSNEKSLFSER